MVRSWPLFLCLLWGLSAVASGLLARRKARSFRMWLLLGLAVGPLSLLIHPLYPSRYVGRTAPCPRCGKAVGTRAVACHHCQHRFPAMDVLITKLPEDPVSRRVLLSEVAREYGIGYADADRKLQQLPVAGHRHITPKDAGQHARSLETAGASVEILPSQSESPSA